MQRWADEVGDASYRLEAMMPHFERSVRYTAPSLTYRNSSNVQAAGGFGQGGPLQVSFGRYEDPFGTWAQRAFEGLGQAAIDGFQTGRLLGSGYMAFSEDPADGHRSSSESSFLRWRRDAAGPVLYNDTLAERIVFEAGAASGVDVSSAGRRYRLRAGREVVVAAGAFQSPQLLMVSGVGPSATLRRHGIEPVAERAGVGQNLCDQAFFGTSFRVALETASAPANDPGLAAAAVEAFVRAASGPLTNPAVPVVGWEKLPAASAAALSAGARRALAGFPADWPDLEFLPVADVLGDFAHPASADPRDGHDYASLATALLTPLSRGSVSISSGSMASPPLIDPNWLGHAVDGEVAVAAFKRQRQAWRLLANITVGPEYLPGPAVQTDADILAFVRRNLIPVWHASATCKMGRADDAMAVVDPSMRVYGTRRLRVVDASVFPFLPPGHPQAIVYALAEKLAAELLADDGGE